MALIYIDELKKTENRPLYVDLKLDLNANYVKKPRLQSFDNIIDLKASYDLEAIYNSLFNIFTTMPGQKILNPTFGLNLNQFLFTAITEDNASMIGEMILKGIQRYEPRVVVRKVYVIPDPDQNTYQIGLRLDVPTLNITGIPLKGSLSESGYYIN